MDIMHWLNTAFLVLAAGFFALLPGLIFWLAVLGFYALIRRISRGHLHRAARGGSLGNFEQPPAYPLGD
jgi:hypothetical protein